MKRLYYAIILFFVFGINEFYSSAEETHLTDHAHSGTNNDSRSVVPLSRIVTRVRRNTPLTRPEWLEKIKKHEDLHNRLMQARLDDQRDHSLQVLLQNFEEITARWMRQGESVTDAVHRFDREHPREANAIVGNPNRRG